MLDLQIAELLRGYDVLSHGPASVERLLFLALLRALLLQLLHTKLHFQLLRHFGRYPLQLFGLGLRVDRLDHAFLAVDALVLLL